MKCFGDKKIFSILYELQESPFHNSNTNEITWGSFQLWVDNKSVCTFIVNDELHEYKWNLLFIVEWLWANLNNILNEDGFPLDCEGSNGLELYVNSGFFDTENENILDEWYERRQDWYYKHSWYSNNGGSYLAEVIFRRVGNTIEITWDNTSLNNKVKYVNPKGEYYIPVNLFEEVVNNFIKDFILEISKSKEGEILIQKVLR